MTACIRTLTALTLTAALLLTATVPALAWENRVEGLPGPVGDTTAYLIGHDGAGWHVATHGPRQQHHFTSVLTTDGTFTDVQLRLPEHPDGVRLGAGGRELRLNFQTSDYVDGVDFRIDGGSRLTFRLQVDDHPIAPGRIYLGAAGQHPERNPFEFWR